MDENDPKTREEAIKRILLVLRTPILLATRPERELAIKLSDLYNISARDLLDCAIKRIRSI